MIDISIITNYLLLVTGIVEGYLILVEFNIVSDFSNFKEIKRFSKIKFASHFINDIIEVLKV